MKNSDEIEQNWEHLFTQFKLPSGDAVICMVHKKTKKHVYFDIRTNRLLSKTESCIFRVDMTGAYAIYPDN